MKFVIQAPEEVCNPFQYSDFQILLGKAKEYRDWLSIDNDDEIIISESYREISNPWDYCPVGSVEWVVEWFKSVHDIDLHPQNVPIKLRDKVYSGRFIIDEYLKHNEIPNINLNYETNYYIKSNDIIKYGGNGVISGNSLKNKPWIWGSGSYQISEIVKVESEWRIFVYKNEIVGCQHYMGDDWLFPNKNIVQDMIKQFDYSGPAYTLDVYTPNGVEWYALEVHDFFSCGLYGFNDLKNYPHMLYKTFKYLINHKLNL